MRNTHATSSHLTRSQQTFDIKPGQMEGEQSKKPELARNFNNLTNTNQVEMNLNGSEHPNEQYKNIMQLCRDTQGQDYKFLTPSGEEEWAIKKDLEDIRHLNPQLRDPILYAVLNKFTRFIMIGLEIEKTLDQEIMSIVRDKIDEIYFKNAPQHISLNRTIENEEKVKKTLTQEEQTKAQKKAEMVIALFFTIAAHANQSAFTGACEKIWADKNSDGMMRTFSNTQNVRTGCDYKRDSHTLQFSEQDNGKKVLRIDSISRGYTVKIPEFPGNFVLENETSILVFRDIEIDTDTGKLEKVRDQVNINSSW